MLKEISNKNELSSFLADFNKERPAIIALDGEDGIGKTSIIAPMLAESAQVISVDDYLEKDKGAYVEFIDYKKLKEKIEESVCVVIEGVLLLKILDRLDIKPDKFLYATGEVWYSEWQNYKDSQKELDEIIKETESRVEMVDKMLNPDKKQSYKLSNFRTEVYKYTYDYRPMDRADVILLFNSSDWLNE